MDAVKCKTIEEAYSALEMHVVKLYSIDRIMKDAAIVYILESNLGFESQHLAEFIGKRFTKFIILKLIKPRSWDCWYAHK